MKSYISVEVSENKVVFFSHPSSRMSWNLSTDPSGVRGRQVKDAALQASFLKSFATKICLHFFRISIPAHLIVLHYIIRVLFSKTK